jgi:hypothetical protein
VPYHQAKYWYFLLVSFFSLVISSSLNSSPTIPTQESFHVDCIGVK